MKLGTNTRHVIELCKKATTIDKSAFIGGGVDRRHGAELDLFIVVCSQNHTTLSR